MAKGQLIHLQRKIVDLCGFSTLAPGPKKPNSENRNISDGRRRVPCGENDCFLVHRDWAAERLARSLSQAAKQRLNSEALYKDGKGDNSKTDGNYFFALRNFKRKSKRKS